MQTIIVGCVIVPGVVAGVAAWAASKREATQAYLIIAVGWCLAVAAAQVACLGLRWSTEEAWQQLIWPLIAWALLVSGTASLSQQSWRWVMVGSLASLTAMIAMPGGEAWRDLFELYRRWIPLVAISCLVNGFAITCMAQRGSERWCLFVTLGGLLGPLVLAATTYGSLAQWSLAIVVATFGAAVAGLLQRQPRVWVIAFPAWAAGTGIVASARFYSYEDHPQWLYGLILFGPVIVAVVDHAIYRRTVRSRVISSAVVSTGIVFVITWMLLRP